MRQRLEFTLALALSVIGCRNVLGVEDLPPIAGADASTVDAGTADVGDHAEDSGTEEVGPPPKRYCEGLSPAPEFCDDFDQAGDLREKWDNHGRNPDPGTMGGGTLAEDTVLFAPGSGPRSLTASTPAAISTASTPAAIFLKTLPSVTPRLSLHLDAYVTTEQFAPGEGGFVVIASIVFGSAGAILVYRDENGAFFGVVPQFGGVRLTEAFPVGVWKQISIVVENTPVDGGPDGRVRFQIDQRTAGQALVPAAFWAAGVKPRVTVGPSTTGPAGPFRLNVDNVAIYYGK